jgi:hypothetical protein
MELVRRSFWFGEELHLLLELRGQGVTKWAFNTFAENFVPLFKLLWVSLVWLSNGGYFGMLTIVWCTHALIVATFYRTLRNAHIGLLPSMAANATLALSWSNIETLMWSVQWSVLLSILFLLFAVNVYLQFSTLNSIARSLRQLVCVYPRCMCNPLFIKRGDKRARILHGDPGHGEHLSV